MNDILDEFEKDPKAAKEFEAAMGNSDDPDVFLSKMREIGEKELADLRRESSELDKGIALGDSSKIIAELRQKTEELEKAKEKIAKQLEKTEIESAKREIIKAGSDVQVAFNKIIGPLYTILVS